MLAFQSLQQRTVVSCWISENQQCNSQCHYQFVSSRGEGNKKEFGSKNNSFIYNLLHQKWQQSLYLTFCHGAPFKHYFFLLQTYSDILSHSFKHPSALALCNKRQKENFLSFLKSTIGFFLKCMTLFENTFQ